MALIPPKVEHEEQHAYVGSIFRLRWRPKDHQRTTCWHPGKKINMEKRVGILGKNKHSVHMAD